MVKKVAILGSTGSIGRKALKVIESLNSTTKESRAGNPCYEVFALTAHSSVSLLAEQAKKYRPGFVCITNPDYYQKLCEMLGDCDTEVLSGAKGMAEIAEQEEVDIVLSAVVGAAGLEAVLAAAGRGKRLAIASKEPLVIAGQLLSEIATENAAEIIPIDSEHSAVFQAMRAGRREEVSRIILTTSGGPFRGFSAADISKVTLEQALAHPVWDMGPKITVDSATMMNKALEVIEARWLFDMPVERIEVLVHPESIVHSLVEFVDGSVVAQLGLPDMCLPIQYALTYPARVAGIAKQLRLEEVERLSFERPNPEVFRSLALGYEVARAGGTAAAVFNAANETAVEQFLEGRIRFLQIVELIEHCLNKHRVEEKAGLEELVAADAWAREETKAAIEQKSYSK